MHAQGSSLSTVCFAVAESELRQSVENLHRQFFTALDPEIFAAARETAEPAADDGEHRHGEAGGDAARDPVISGCLPVRRKRMVHRAARAGVRGLDTQTDRAKDVLLRRWMHVLGKEGCFCQHRRPSVYQ